MRSGTACIVPHPARKCGGNQHLCSRSPSAFMQTESYADVAACVGDQVDEKRSFMLARTIAPQPGGTLALLYGEVAAMYC